MRRHPDERGFAALVWAAALVVTAVFVWILADLLLHGLGKLSWDFLTEAPRSAGRRGGIGPILVSTLLILAVTLAVAVPLSLAAAMWMSEFARRSSRIARGISFCLDVLAGVPSIVFGLFGNALFSVYLGLGFSIWSGGLTLACMVLPIMIRATEAGLAAVPPEWRQGAAALGLTKGAALYHVLLPAALPAMTAGLLLGIGRAMAETAALIFTSGYVDRMPESLMDSGRALAVHIYDLSMNVSGGDRAAYASALVLIALLVLINGAALLLSDRFSRKRVLLS
ncbi:MAG: phosphate ABC transporter permease PstA [Betaproteobacteria bacterium]|nr:phosphate ABC transporter permease PstA [Betaproteobacteria bacterium]